MADGGGAAFNTLAMALVGLLLVSLVLGGIYSWHKIRTNPFTDRGLFGQGMNKPVLWLYYDQSDVNSRWWKDFGARSDRALNMPFLNLCYETIVTRNRGDYRVEVIGGLQGVAELLGGYENMPLRLRNPIASVNEAEMNWIRAAVLAKYGGLWLSPYSVCLQSFGKLPTNKVRFYGTDIGETYSGSAGTSVPGLNCIWVPRAAHPMFVEWEQMCRARLDGQRGGQQIRRDANWDWVALTAKYADIEVDVHAELARKRGGRRIELEDLLAAGQEGRIPFAIPGHAVYVPIFWPELRDREFFGWFLRMSEQQIMESDLVIRDLFLKGLKDGV